MGLKSNTKCKIAWIGVLKGAQVAVCSVQCIDLKWSYQNLMYIPLIQSENKRWKKNFNIFSNIQGVVNLWRIRNLILSGRMVVLKMLAILKIVFLALLTKMPYQILKELFN